MARNRSIVLPPAGKVIRNDNAFFYHSCNKIYPREYFNENEVPWFMHLYLDFTFNLSVYHDQESVKTGCICQKREDSM